jgi:hypothetical protein
MFTEGKRTLFINRCFGVFLSHEIKREFPG